MKRFAFIFAFSVLLMNCSQKTYTFGSLPEEYFIVAHGGGFTGAVTEYYVLPNGQVFKKNTWRDTMPEIMGTIAKKSAQHTLEFLEKLGKENVAVNEPDNIYKYFILVDDGKRTQWLWYKETEETFALEQEYLAVMEAIEKASAAKK